jgi:hypothetical protein
MGRQGSPRATKGSSGQWGDVGFAGSIAIVPSCPHRLLIRAHQGAGRLRALAHHLTIGWPAVGYYASPSR